MKYYFKKYLTVKALFISGLILFHLNSFADDLRKELQERSKKTQNENTMIEEFMKVNEVIICNYYASKWNYARKGNELFYIIKKQPFMLFVYYFNL
jgi:hypothetical protein